MALVLLGPAAATGQLFFPSKFPFEEGDVVQVEGIVSDALGRPLPNLEVVLEMAKLRISLRPPGREKANISRGATTTDAEGHFALQWTWRRGYDRFELIAAVHVPEPAGKRLQILERVDITAHVEQGSPIEVPVVLKDSSLVDGMRTFQSHLDSEDEHRVYDHHGLPDRVESDVFEGREESSWWYFTIGKAYRFDDGRLIQVEEFDPVDPI